MYDQCHVCVYEQVKDRGLWRAALENGGYSPQTDEAPFAQIQSPKKTGTGIHHYKAVVNVKRRKVGPHYMQAPHNDEN